MDLCILDSSVIQDFLEIPPARSVAEKLKIMGDGRQCLPFPKFWSIEKDSGGEGFYFKQPK
jgi:hypothetical protein